MFVGLSAHSLVAIGNFQWFSKLPSPLNGMVEGNHWDQWFSNGFGVRQPLVPMVFDGCAPLVRRWNGYVPSLKTTMIATQPHVADESRPTLPVPRCSSSLPGYPPGFHQTNINSMKLNIFFPACGAFHWGRFCEGLPKVRLVFLQTGRPTWTGPRLHQSLEGEPRPAAILANCNLYVVSLGEAFNA